MYRSPGSAGSDSTRVVVLVAFVLALGTTLFSGDSRAAPLVKIGGEVLDVSAKHLDVDLERGDATLEGDVRVTFGDLDVFCEKIEIRYDDAPLVRWARGTGHVRATMKGVAATAQSLEVDVPERRVRLVGTVKIERGRGWIQADRASIDLVTNRIALEQVRGSIPVVSAAR